MRIERVAPRDPTIVRLWTLRGQSAETCGVHSRAAVREILDAFAGLEPGKTFAACLIVSDGIQELRVMAREYLVARLGADVSVDALTGLLCLEALQFVPDICLAQPAVCEFIKQCAGLRDSSDLALMLLERLRRMGYK
jgi:hypothetical protein